MIRSDSNVDLFWAKLKQGESSLILKSLYYQEDTKDSNTMKKESALHIFREYLKICIGQNYFEALDLAVTRITKKFDQPGLKIYSNIEQLLFKACSGIDNKCELDIACNFYEDLSRGELESQLLTLRTLYLESKEGKPTVADLEELLGLSSAQRTLVC